MGLPIRPYSTGPHNCYRCGRTTPVELKSKKAGNGRIEFKCDCGAAWQMLGKRYSNTDGYQRGTI